MDSKAVHTNWQNITAMVLAACGLVCTAGVLADVTTLYRKALYGTFWFDVLSAGCAYTAAIICLSSAWMTRRGWFGGKEDSKGLPCLDWIEGHWLGAILGLQGLITLGLFAFPVWKFVNGGLLPDFCIFVDSMNNAANGLDLLNHFHPATGIISRSGSGGQPIEQMHEFATHFRPYLYLLLPFYKLVTHPFTLLAVQALITASAVWPMYLLAMEFIHDRKLSFLSTACMGMHPALLGALNTFFPSYAAITFLLWGLYFLRKKKPLLVILMLLLTLSLKELLGLPVAAFGVVMAFQGYRILGAGVALGSLAYVACSLHYIIPYYSDGMVFQFYNFYAEYGDNILAAVKNVIMHPWLIVLRLIQPEVLAYLSGLLVTMAFLPLGSFYYLANIPVLMQNIFATGFAYSLDIAGHLTPPLVPFTFLAFVHTLVRLKSRHCSIFMVKLLLACVLLALAFIPLAAHGPYTDSDLHFMVTRLKSVAPRGSIIETDVIGLVIPTLVKHYHVGSLTNNWNQADYLLLSYSFERIETAKKQKTLTDKELDAERKCLLLIDKITKSAEFELVTKRDWRPNPYYPYEKYPPEKHTYLLLLRKK